MRPEEIALRLQQVRAQARRAVAVVVGQRGAEGRHRDAVAHRQRHHLAPVLLRAVQQVLKERVEHQVAQRRVAAEGVGDAVQKARADDAAAAPDRGDAAQVELPAFLLAHGLDQVEALRVADDLRGVERVVHLGHQRLFLQRQFDLRPLQQLAGRHALLLLRRQHARLDGGVDGADDHRVLGRVQQRPLARAFLAGLVQDEVDHRLAGFRVFLFERLGGDLDQVALQLALVPFVEDRGHLVGREAGRLEQAVGLADQLHVAVLDAVVHHLHVVARAARADVDHAGLAVHLGRDALEDRLHHLPGRRRAARHDRRPLARAFLAARHARADEAQALARKVGVAPFRVGVQAVAAVDDDVILVEQRNELLDHLVDRRAGLHHDLDLAGLGQALDELLERLRAHQLLAGVGGKEGLGGGLGAVVDADLEAAAFHVQHQVLSHHGQADQSEIALLAHVCRALRACAVDEAGHCAGRLRGAASEGVYTRLANGPGLAMLAG
ncbi:hypothetical protein D3C71_625820 [compost metagenome]